MKEFKLSTELNEWRYKGSNFMVEICHWKNPDSFVFPIENKWNVYAYVYDNHPSFDLITSESLFDYGSVVFPLHSGASYHRWLFDKNGKCIYKKTGSDYGHAWDEKYIGIDKLEYAYQVVRDAKELFDFMESFNATKE